MATVSFAKNSGVASKRRVSSVRSASRSVVLTTNRSVSPEPLRNSKKGVFLSDIGKAKNFAYFTGVRQANGIFLIDSQMRAARRQHDRRCRGDGEGHLRR